MKTYYIKQSQLEKIVESEKTQERVLTDRDAMLNIIEFLKNKDYSDENIMDVILQLRYKDEFTHKFMLMNVGSDPTLIDSINKIFNR